MSELRDDTADEALGRLADEFLAHCRRGEPLSVDQFALQHPQYAEEVRALFPALLLLEQRKIDVFSQVNEQIPFPSRLTDSFPPRLGEYELVRELGRGGMGVVYEARQESLGRSVAIKILPRRVIDHERIRERFLREARIVARLRHPHIVAVHDVGEEDGMLYYAMDLVEGTSLDQIEPPQPLPGDAFAHARWVAELGVQAAEALAHAHSRGILHRDIKPANFLLDHEGWLWLTDFGLAKLLGEPSLSVPGDCPGTLRYLAPECLRGEASPRSDLYGLGLTLQELLTGIPAFPETDRSRLMGQIGQSSSVPPRRLDANLPRDLEKVIVKATAHDPSNRYSSATELAADLERFLAGRAVHAQPSGPVSWLRSHRALAAVLAAGVLLSLVVIVLIGNALRTGTSSPGRLDPPDQRQAGTSATAPTEPQPPAASGARNGPPWGLGRRHQPAGPGGGAGFGAQGPRRGMKEQGGNDQP